MPIENETPAQKRERLRLEAACAGLARVLHQGLRDHFGDGPPIGFALIMFDFGKGGNLAYASNGVREDMRRALREMVEKLDIDAEAAQRGGRST